MAGVIAVLYTLTFNFVGTFVAPLNVKTKLNVKTAKCEKPNNYLGSQTSVGVTACCKRYVGKIVSTYI